MILIIALFASFATANNPKYSCMTPEEFQKENSSLNNLIISESGIKTTDNDSSLQTLFRTKTKIDTSNPDVKTLVVDGEPIKIENNEFSSDKVYPTKTNHYTSSRRICEIGDEAKFFKLSDCKSDFIFRFKGCVDDGSVLYDFQEYIPNTYDISKYEILEKYSKLSGKDKSEFMLKITSIFEKIHAKNIVHGKISPSAILMIETNFNEIRIVNFDYSGQKGEDITTAYNDPYFFPSGTNESTRLSFSQDVYALAVTFAMMELSTYKYLKENLTADCFGISRGASKECIQSYRKGVIAAFNQENQTEPLKSVIERAINEDPNKRFESMTDFAKAIVEVQKDLPTEANIREAISIKIYSCEEIPEYIYMLYCRLGYSNKSSQEKPPEKKSNDQRVIL